VHQPGAESRRVGKVAEEFGIRIRHADIVDENTDIQILKLGADSIVNFSSAGEIHIDDTSFDSVIRFCKIIKRNLLVGHSQQKTGKYASADHRRKTGSMTEKKRFLRKTQGGGHGLIARRRGRKKKYRKYSTLLVKNGWWRGRCLI